MSAYKHCNLAMPALRVCVCFMSIPPVFLYYESVIGMLSWSVVCAYSVLKAWCPLSWTKFSYDIYDESRL